MTKGSTDMAQAQAQATPQVEATPEIPAELIPLNNALAELDEILDDYGQVTSPRLKRHVLLGLIAAGRAIATATTELGKAHGVKPAGGRPPKNGPK